MDNNTSRYSQKYYLPPDLPHCYKCVFYDLCLCCNLEFLRVHLLAVTMSQAAGRGNVTFYGGIISILLNTD